MIFPSSTYDFFKFNKGVFVFPRYKGRNLGAVANGSAWRSGVVSDLLVRSQCLLDTDLSAQKKSLVCPALVSLCTHTHTHTEFLVAGQNLTLHSYLGKLRPKPERPVD